MRFVVTLRPDGTLLYLPPQMAQRLGVKDGDQLSEAVYADRGVQAMIASRIACNVVGGHCNAEWHEKNGYL